MNGSNGCHSVAASTPGGMARQFRVQILGDSSREGRGVKWHMVKSFRTRDLADECAGELNSNGREARVVSYNICPAAS